MPRSATALSLYSDSREEENTNSVMSDPPSSVSQDRIILVANMLPLHAERNAEKTVSTQYDDSHAFARETVHTCNLVAAHTQLPHVALSVRGSIAQLSPSRVHLRHVCQPFSELL